jgi:hypothetical protein
MEKKNVKSSAKNVFRNLATIAPQCRASPTNPPKISKNHTGAIKNKEEGHKRNKNTWPNEAIHAHSRRSSEHPPQRNIPNVVERS